MVALARGDVAVGLPSPKAGLGWAQRDAGGRRLPWRNPAGGNLAPISGSRAGERHRSCAARPRSHRSRGRQPMNRVSDGSLASGRPQPCAVLCPCAGAPVVQLPGMLLLWSIPWGITGWVGTSLEQVKPAPARPGFQPVCQLFAPP